MAAAIPQGAGPPPPEGAGPPDGAIGPPLEAGGNAAPPPSAEGGTPPPGPPGSDWLEVHLKTARAFWQDQAETLAETGGTAAPLAERARKMAEAVPALGERPPPLPEVVILLNRELELLDDMKAAGLDTSAVERELATLLAHR